VISHCPELWGERIAVNGILPWYMRLNDFGGMSDVVINLYDITKDPEHLPGEEALELP
jgi:hypothetical protein